MSQPGPKDPVVENVPNGERRAETSEHALHLRILQQEMLAELGVAALRGTPLTELLNEAVVLSARGLEAELAKVLEYDASSSRLVMRAGVGWDPGLTGVASLGADLGSPSGFALRTGKPVISNHLEHEERFRTPELLAAHGVRRAINVILQGDGTPYGILEVDSRTTGEFTEKDITFLQGAANILGMAIERQRRERALHAALEHQKVLLQEINHRVKNSLQLVASMLTLQAASDPLLKQRLQEASSRIMAIGRAHDRLYRSPEVEQIDLGDYLPEICNDLTEVVGGCDISCESTGQVWLNTDRAIALALVVNELVTNAAKHAYPKSRCGKIWIRLAPGDADMARLSVRDEGVGVPPDFDINARVGLGMRITRALTHQAKVELRIERHSNGTEFIMEIPLATRRPSAAM
jgi:two-component sensor histidine kinase